MRTLGVYAGSFNPFHIGHLNVAQKASRIFDGVLISFGVNPEKNEPDRTGKTLDPVLSNVKPAKFIAPNVSVCKYNLFLHEHIENLEFWENEWRVILVRGLRNGDDLAYEEKQLQFVREFKPDIETVFIMCDPEFSHISSSAIRNLEKFRPTSGARYIVQDMHDLVNPTVN